MEMKYLRGTCVMTRCKEVLIEGEVLNKQGGNVWIWRGGGSSGGHFWRE